MQQILVFLSIVMMVCVTESFAAESFQVSVPEAISPQPNQPQTSVNLPGGAAAFEKAGKKKFKKQSRSGLEIGLNFTGSTLFDNSSFIPPDTMGGVGADHIVELINGRYAVYRKSDGVLLQTSTLDQFWRDAGIAFTNFTFDPRILYDPFARRWFALSVDNSFGDNQFLFAVSRSADPTAGWVGFSIDTDSTDLRWADYPTLGFNRDGVFISANMFAIPGRAGAGLANTIIVIPKNDLLGDAPAMTRATLFETNSIDPAIGMGFTVQPVVDLDNNARPSASLLSSPLSTVSSSFFTRSSITGDMTSPELRAAEDLISVTPFFASFSANQPGPKQNVEIANGSIFHGNIVQQNGALWGVQTVEHQGRAALRWFQIDAESNRLLQEGLIADVDLNFFYGSIAVNKFDDVVIGFSGAGEAQFISSYVTAGKTIAGVTTFEDPVLLQAGAATYFQDFGTGRNRWGDYSATVIDPTDPFGFWTFQEFVSREDVWSTQITQVSVPRAQPVNKMVSFIPDESSFETISDAAGCPAGFTSRFNFMATLANEGGHALSHLLVKTTELPDDALLQNADYGPDGVGATLAVPKSGSFTDRLLSRGETVDVPFSICLQGRSSFKFSVDVLGIVQSDRNDRLVSK